MQLQVAAAGGRHRCVLAVLLTSYASDMSLNFASACALLSGFLSCHTNALSCVSIATCLLYSNSLYTLNPHKHWMLCWATGTR
jgi:hypothetical protein